MNLLAPAKLYGTTDSDREVTEGVRASTGPEPYRSPYRRDFARLIHSPAFRRLQGKTQVFPPHESDFFRNRLTHSLEVAQIAKSIAARLNYETPLFHNDPIDLDIVETAALAHDLGHPPFGHNGERALDDCLKDCGGFEGNAQTFRIVTKLEKKTLVDGVQSPVSTEGIDYRAGLNWAYRSIASIVKYDRVIPLYRMKESGLLKGIYKSDEAVYNRVKAAVCPSLPTGREFRTIEASIMDVADDIAYSIYDLEDALKSGFQSILGLMNSDNAVYERVAAKASKAMKSTVGVKDVKRTLFVLLENSVGVGYLKEQTYPIIAALKAERATTKLANNGYLRTAFLADMVSAFLSAVKVNEDAAFPMLSTAYLEEDALLTVECLKHFTFETMIMSPRLRVAEARGYDLISNLFTKLAGKNGHLFMPDDFQEIYRLQKDDSEKQRTIADFIAGMTDRYAIEFYGRLVSDDPVSIFKDL